MSTRQVNLSCILARKDDAAKKFQDKMPLHDASLQFYFLLGNLNSSHVYILFTLPKVRRPCLNGRSGSSVGKCPKLVHQSLGSEHG